MIHNVYVFDENGTPLLTLKVGSIETDTVLLTGFLSAMQSFSQKIAQGDIEEINIKEYKFHIRRVQHIYVALVGDKSDSELPHRLDEVSKIVAQNITNFSDITVQERVREAVTKKTGMADRARGLANKAKSWAEAGL